jgi:ABC-2 type transport system permease protein
MREAWLIARREYLERVRSKAFRLSTIVIPLVFAAIFGIGAFSGNLTGVAKYIVVASNDPILAEGVGAELTANYSSRTGSSKTGRREKGRQTVQPHVDVRAPIAESDLVMLNRQVEDKSIDGYLWLNVSPGQTQPKATYVSRGTMDLGGNDGMRNVIGRALAREALMKHGISSAEARNLMQDVELKTRQLKNGQSAASDAGKSFWGAYAMALLLYFVVVFYGMNVAHSVVAEKTSRVFEVLLATARPESLMAGKLLGVGAAGLTQIGVWMGAALLFSSPTLGAQLGHDGLAAYGITVQQLIFFIIYFLLGFFFYSALSAGFGATVSQEAELQQFAMVLMLPLLLALMLMMYILGNPAALPVVLLSLFPPCTPIVMCLRMSAMAVPWWQLGLSIVLMVAAIYGVLWLVSRIYRVGILMYGKRATLPEIVRWLRYS